jgi:hypothetical protein
MLSRATYAIVAIVVVALSFSGTLFVLNRWSAASDSQPLFTSSIRSALPSSAVSPIDAQATVLEALPKATGFDWYVVRGLNVRTASEGSVVAGQPILRLITTPNETGHSLVAQYRGLKKNQVYRITAWVKPEAGGNVEIAGLDHPEGTPVNNGIIVADLQSNTLLTASGVRARGVERGPDNWQKVWIDLATADGQFLVAVRPTRGGEDTFSGDGRLGVILGGIQVAPQG